MGGGGIPNKSGVVWARRGASTPSTGEMLRVVRAAFTLTPFCCFSGQPGRKKVVDALKARWEALLAQLSEAIAAAQYPDIEVFYKARCMCLRRS